MILMTPFVLLRYVAAPGEGCRHQLGAFSTEAGDDGLIERPCFLTISSNTFETYVNLITEMDPLRFALELYETCVTSSAGENPKVL